jgi:DNA-binding PucR family transcriptional regulator
MMPCCEPQPLQTPAARFGLMGRVFLKSCWAEQRPERVFDGIKRRGFQLHIQPKRRMLSKGSWRNQATLGGCYVKEW